MALTATCKSKFSVGRKEAFVNDGKVKLVTMDLVGALMLKLRGYRPYLILAHYSDKRTLNLRQFERKETRNFASEKKLSSTECAKESSALQVLLSGRIIINGILNEILQLLSEDKLRSEFTLDSECSIMMDSKTRRNQDFRAIDRIAMSISSSTLSEDKGEKDSCINSGLYSLYKEAQGTDEYVSDVCGHEERNHSKKPPAEARSIINKQNLNASARKSIDFSKMSSTWKGLGADSRKSSKSVTFTSPENTAFIEPSPTGMLVELQSDVEMENLLQLTSISAKVAWPTDNDLRPRDSDLWLEFLVENGLPVNSESSLPRDQHRDTKTDDPDFIVNQLDYYKEIPSESFTTHIRDTYEEIHRNTPGLFFDTVTMDNPEAAFQKMKRLIKNIVKSQQDLKPMIDIDFSNMKNCSIVKKKLANICNQIAPQRLFY